MFCGAVLEPYVTLCQYGLALSGVYWLKFCIVYIILGWMSHNTYLQDSCLMACVRIQASGALFVEQILLTGVTFRVLNRRRGIFQGLEPKTFVVKCLYFSMVLTIWKIIPCGPCHWSITLTLTHFRFV